MPSADWLRDERRRLAREGKAEEAACIAVEESEELRRELANALEKLDGLGGEDDDDDDGDDEHLRKSALAALKR